MAKNDFDEDIQEVSPDDTLEKTRHHGNPNPLPDHNQSPPPYNDKNVGTHPTEDSDVDSTEKYQEGAA